MRKLLIVVATLAALYFAVRHVQKAYGDELTKPAPAGFAECLAKKGYAVYGATWCHWCKAQKAALFGNENTERPPYVNCQTVYGASLHAECKGKPIEGFPTWLGPSGQPTNPNGFMTPKQLSDLSGCPLK